MTHDDLLDLLRNDIASHDMLQDRRAAIENYMLFVDTCIKFDSAYEPDESCSPFKSDEEIDQLFVVSCTQ